MSLNRGRPLMAIPGPSIIPDRVLSAMHRPSPNIYEGALLELTDSLVPDLKAVARTQHNVVMYIANGHGAWEAAISNTLAPGDKALVLGTGRFGPGWGEVATRMGVEIETLDFGMHGDADPNALEDRLRADTNGEIKAVLVVLADTATSVLNDIAALRKAIDAAGHDALFMVDAVASLGCDVFEMEEWGVDVTVAGCQKGLMTPAGMSFVYYNDKADRARESVRATWYWDWRTRTNPSIFYMYFGGTPPTQHLYGLREALDMLVHEEGVEAAWARHRVFAEAIWAAIEAMGLSHNISDPEKRSLAVSAICAPKGAGRQIREWCEHEAGLTLGIPLGFGTPGDLESDARFRIGHMGHQNIVTTMGIIGAIEAAMEAHGAAHTKGAIAAASKVFAKATAGN